MIAPSRPRPGRGRARLGLTEDELAFYDALEANNSAVKVPGDATLQGRPVQAHCRGDLGLRPRGSTEDPAHRAVATKNA